MNTKKTRVPRKNATAEQVAKVIQQNREEFWEPSSQIPDPVDECFAHETLRVRHPVTAYVNACLIAGVSVPDDQKALKGMAYGCLYKDRVVKRVAWLREKAYLNLKVTAESLSVELDQAVELAARLEDPRGMTNALDVKRRCFAIGDRGSSAENYVPPQKVVVEVVSASRE